MQLHIIAHGKIGRGPEADLVKRYLARISWKVKVTELPDAGGSMPAPKNQPVRNVMLDEKGRQITSVEFAHLLARWRDDGVREARFLIGAADGFDDCARRGADMLIAFGTMTWPHMMARAMLAEQLYRAVSIIANYPYHREG